LVCAYYFGMWPTRGCSVDSSLHDSMRHGGRALGEPNRNEDMRGRDGVGDAPPLQAASVDCSAGRASKRVRHCERMHADSKVHAPPLFPVAEMRKLT